MGFLHPILPQQRASVPGPPMRYLMWKTSPPPCVRARTSRRGGQRKLAMETPTGLTVKLMWLVMRGTPMGTHLTSKGGADLQLAQFPQAGSKSKVCVVNLLISWKSAMGPQGNKQAASKIDANRSKSTTLAQKFPGSLRSRQEILSIWHRPQAGAAKF